MNTFQMKALLNDRPPTGDSINLNEYGFFGFYRAGDGPALINLSRVIVKGTKMWSVVCEPNHSDNTFKVLKIDSIITFQGDDNVDIDQAFDGEIRTGPIIV